MGRDCKKLHLYPASKQMVKSQRNVMSPPEQNLISNVSTKEVKQVPE